MKSAVALWLGVVALASVLTGQGVFGGSNWDWAVFLALLYGLTSLLTFAAYASDKRQAKRKGDRVPERALHFLELAGGWPGAFAAQRFVRHKNVKPAFQAVFWLIVALHAAGWGWWWFRGR